MGSKLVTMKIMSPNNSGQRTHEIDRITPHCMVGQLSARKCGQLFARASYQASSNYGIGKDGEIALYVDESRRSWCSSSESNDQRAVTIECASDTRHPYAMYAKVYASLVRLCVDICRRNGKKKLIWFGDKTKTLSYSPKSDEMVLTVHRWFAQKSCPGDWLYSRLGDLAKQVTAQLKDSPAEAGSTAAETAGESAAAPVTPKYRVQCGAFSSRENAQKRVDKLKAAGFDAVIMEGA